MFNRSEMFKRAHFMAGLRRFGNRSKSYRQHFADCLRYEYQEARRRALWVAQAAERERLRDEQNVSPPIASSAYDRPAFYTRRSRYMSAGQ